MIDHCYCPWQTEDPIRTDHNSSCKKIPQQNYVYAQLRTSDIVDYAVARSLLLCGCHFQAVLNFCVHVVVVFVVVDDVIVIVVVGGVAVVVVAVVFLVILTLSLLLVVFM